MDVTRAAGMSQWGKQEVEATIPAVRQENHKFGSHGKDCCVIIPQYWSDTQPCSQQS